MIARSNEQRWMVSYIDVLTVLLIFFLAAAAQSYKPPAPPPPAPVVEAPKPADPLAEVERALRAANLHLERNERGLLITLPQEILFAPGDDHIRSAALPALGTIAQAVTKVPNRITLAGHADTTPIHNARFRGNWDLAAARSVRLLEVLTARLGLDESRFSVESHGSRSPRGSNHTAEGRALNRRVEILLVR